MPDLNIRRMHPDEFDEMRTVSMSAFGEQGPGIGELLDSLRGSWAWRDELAWVAERDGEIVAQVLYTISIIDAPTQLVEVLVLSPVGVRPDLHGTGIGTRLISESLAAIEARDEAVVFLEGDPRYYHRFGFEAAVGRGFVRPSVRTPEVAFQVRGLPEIPADLTGQLVYPDAFWLTDSVGLR